MGDGPNPVLYHESPKDKGPKNLFPDSDQHDPNRNNVSDQKENNVELATLSSKPITLQIDPNSFPDNSPDNSPENSRNNTELVTLNNSNLRIDPVAVTAEHSPDSSPLYSPENSPANSPEPSPKNSTENSSKNISIQSPSGSVQSSMIIPPCETPTETTFP